MPQPAMPQIERARIAIAIVEDRDRFLIGTRPAGVHLAGYWEFPGGKMLPGESPGDAATRECLEETGLSVAAIGQFPTAIHDYPDKKLELHFIHCRCLSADEPRSPFRWAPRGDLEKYAFPEANRGILAAIATRQPSHSITS